MAATRRAAVDLAGLLRAAAAIPGVLRVRYTTSHPQRHDGALILAHRDNPRWPPICIFRSSRARIGCWRR